MTFRSSDFRDRYTVNNFFDIDKQDDEDGQVWDLWGLAETCTGARRFASCKDPRHSLHR